MDTNRISKPTGEVVSGVDAIETFISEMKNNSIIFYDFDNNQPEFINISDTDLLGNEDKTLSMNQNGVNNQYIQTVADVAQYPEFSISVWFKTDNPLTIQTLFWQGVSTQNGWGNGANNPSLAEFHINLNHFTNTTGNALAAFYGYNDQSVSPDLVAINFPYAFDGSVNGNLVTLDNSWHHLVAVVSQSVSSVTISVYYDGALIGSQTGTQVDNSQWDEFLRIGRPGADTRKFRGELDSFLLIDRSLNSSEILNLFNYGRNI